MKFFSRGSKGIFYSCLSIELVLIFSFINAYGIFQLIGSEGDNSITVLSEDNKILRINYQAIRYFVNESPIFSPDQLEKDYMLKPILSDIWSLKNAMQAMQQNRLADILRMGIEIQTEYPFLLKQKQKIMVQAWYLSGMYADVVRELEQNPPTDSEIRALYIASLLKLKRNNMVFECFQKWFATAPLNHFVDILGQKTLEPFLKKLDFNFWSAKFDYLLDHGMISELHAEMKVSKLPQLNQIYLAELQYRKKNYQAVRTLLAPLKASQILLFKEKLLIKTALRLDEDIPDLQKLLQMFGSTKELLAELLFDVAAIIQSKGQYQAALPYFEAYLALFPETDEQYWKTLWQIAWIRYRLGNTLAAQEYFQKGSLSPFITYRTANLYWLGKANNTIHESIFHYPFSYYAVRLFNEQKKFQQLPISLNNELAKKPQDIFLKALDDTKCLFRYGLTEEAVALIEDIKNSSQYNGSERLVMTLIDAVLLQKQEKYQLAFTKIRDGIKDYQSLKVPSFLSQIIFPVKYSDLIISYSQKYNIDPYLIMALIREETFYRSEAVSQANAKGLMQLLDKTAYDIAASEGTKFNIKHIFNPDTNIHYGIAYFKTLLDHYNGRIYLTLAAYNAGDHRVDDWLKQSADYNEEEFIEMIPFSETRSYVKNIIRNQFFYRYYYSKN